jgi:hypothetical protein
MSMSAPSSRPAARARSSSSRSTRSSGSYSCRMNTQPCSAPTQRMACSIPSTIRCDCSARIWRSLNVPGSASSALQITYFGPSCWPRTMSHFTPVGNPAPPMPFTPASLSTGTGSPVNERSTP